MDSIGQSWLKLPKKAVHPGNHFPIKKPADQFRSRAICVLESLRLFRSEFLLTWFDLSFTILAEHFVEHNRMPLAVPLFGGLIMPSSPRSHSHLFDRIDIRATDLIEHDQRTHDLLLHR